MHFDSSMVSYCLFVFATPLKNAGWNRLPVGRHDFDIGFSNIGFGLHTWYGGKVADTVGRHYCAGHIHVHHVAILPGIAQVHVNQQEEGHRSRER